MDGAFGILTARCVVFEFLASNAIPALLTPLHDVAVGLHAVKKLSHQLAVARVGGADEAVVADLPTVPKIAISLAD